MNRLWRIVASLALLVGMAGAAPAAAEEKYAVLVGVCNYQDAAIPKLSGCINDAKLMKKLLVEKAGFKAENIKIVDDPNSTKAGIQSAVDEVLVARPGPEDMILFFYSGHGCDVDDTTEALVPIDAKLSDASSFIADSELSGWLKPSKAKEVVVMLDACHSGTNIKSLTKKKGFALPGRGGRSKGASFGSMAKDLESMGKPMVLLAACQFDQTAEDKKFDDGRWQGLFTYSVGETMNKMDPATVSNTKYVDFAEDVKRLVAEKMEGNQTPVVRMKHTEGHGMFTTSAAGSAPPPSNSGTAATVTLPATGGKLKVYVEQLVGDTNGSVTQAVKDALKGESYVELVGGKDLVAVAATDDNMPRADRIVRGSAAQLQATLFSEAGNAINTVSGADAGALGAAIAAEVRRSYTFGWLAGLTNPNSPFKVGVKVNYASIEPQPSPLPAPPNSPFKVGVKVNGGDNPTVGIGQTVSFSFVSDRDCYLTLIDVGTSGTVTVLFPNQFHKDNFVKAGQEITIPDSSMGFKIQAQGPPGREMVKAIATLENIDITAAFPPGQGFKSFKNAAAFRSAFVTGLAKALKVKPSATKDLVIVQATQPVPDGGNTPPPAPPANADAKTDTQWAEDSTVLTIQ